MNNIKVNYKKIIWYKKSKKILNYKIKDKINKLIIKLRFLIFDINKFINK